MGRAATLWDEADRGRGVLGIRHPGAKGFVLTLLGVGLLPLGTVLLWLVLTGAFDARFVTVALGFSLLAGVSGFALSVIVGSTFSPEATLPVVLATIGSAFAMFNIAGINEFIALPPGSFFTVSDSYRSLSLVQDGVWLTIPVLLALICCLLLLRFARLRSRVAAVVILAAIVVVGLPFDVSSLSSEDEQRHVKVSEGVIVLEPAIRDQLLHELNRSERLPATPYSYMADVGPYTETEVLLYALGNISGDVLTWEEGRIHGAESVGEWRFGVEGTPNRTVEVYEATVDVGTINGFSHDPGFDGPIRTHQDSNLFLSQVHAYHHWLGLFASLPSMLPIMALDSRMALKER